MSNLLGELGGIAANTVGETVAFAGGTAASRTLSPIAEAISQKAWETAPIKLPAAEFLAVGVAQGQVDPHEAAAWAKKQGFGETQWLAMVDIATTGPGVAAAFDLWRRGVIDEVGFRRAVQRQGLEGEWIDDLVKIKQNVLGPADLARGIHRGLVRDPGLLQGELPGGVGHVPAYPVYDIDALAEAEAAGFDKDHLGVLVGLQGNPMGPHEAAEALFRGVLTHDDFLRAIAEGNTRNEWAEAILNQTRQIPTARDFIENALRGYTSLDAALAGAARHGMNADDATLIYQNSGRPMALHQITTGLARGGKFKPEAGEITDPFMASIVEGSLKPAYYDLAFANRYTYPSPLALRAIAAAGDINAADLEQLLLEIGWKPDLAAKIAPIWATTTAAKGDAHIAKAQTQLWNAIHRSYVDEASDETQARAALGALSISTDAQSAVLALWNHERAIVRSQLTAAQIKKAVGQPGKDTAWATERLLELGYDQADAETFLAE